MTELAWCFVGFLFGANATMLAWLFALTTRRRES